MRPCIARRAMSQLRQEATCRPSAARRLMENWQCLSLKFVPCSRVQEDYVASRLPQFLPTRASTTKAAPSPPPGAAISSQFEISARYGSDALVADRNRSLPKRRSGVVQTRKYGHHHVNEAVHRADVGLNRSLPAPFRKEKALLYSNLPGVLVYRPHTKHPTHP